jgi:hypothetical protein
VFLAGAYAVRDFLAGHGYEAFFVEGSDPTKVHQDFAATLEPVILRGCLKSPDSVIFRRLCFPIPASKQLGRTLVSVP